MHKCEHNDKMTLFCVSEHCEWKQPAGCQRCTKKYHNHIVNKKIIAQQQLMTITQKLSLQHIPKPNCRKIQQSLYSYFTTLKTDLTASIDLICKTLINAIGSPYLTENHLLTVYKRVKNKEYKRLQQKDFRKFYQTALKLNTTDIAKQQSKLYKEQLKKSHNFINGLQTVLATYQELFKLLNQNFQRQKSSFEILASLLKHTIENADLSINLSQFHEREMEKNKAERAQKQDKNIPNDLKKLKHEYDSMLSTQYSSRLASTAKQKITKTPQVSKTPQVIKAQSNIKQDFFYDSANHKFGVKDFGTLQRLQKSDSQQIKNKRPLSLDKKLAINLQIQIPTSTQRKRNDLGFIDQIKNAQNDRPERQKITFLQKHESILNDLGSENSTKKSEQSTPGPFDKSSLRQNEISVRKEQLIEMMRNQSSHRKGGEKEKWLERSEIRAINYSSVLVKPKVEQNAVEENPRKNSSDFFGDKFSRKESRSSQKSHFEQRKTTDPNSHMISSLHNRTSSLKPLVQKLSALEMPNVVQDIEKSSQGSLEVIKKIPPKKNMNAHPRLSIEEAEQRPKQLAQSRLIIVPTGSKFTVDKVDECNSPLFRKKGSKKDSEKLVQKNLKNQKITYSQGKQQKPDIKQGEQKSVSLLIRSIHLPVWQAIPALQSALKQAPNNLSAAEYLSYLYLEQLKPRQALQTCNTILDRFEIISKENEELLINLENNKAAALNMLGRYSEAIVLLERGIRCNETETLLKNLGDAYYFGSNYDKALFYYEKAVKSSPQFDEAYYNMAVCLYLQNNFHNALQSVVKALENAPKNGDYLELKANIELKITQASNL